MGGVVRAEKPRRKERTVADVRRETQRRVPWEEREVDAAHVRGWRDWRSGGDEDVDPAGRPLQEAGEGEAEGFELADENLVEAAETGVTWIDPIRAVFPAESEDGSDRLTVG
jgi:hypothetical protein